MTRRARPTIVDVARAAGVSPTTVSYVLSGPRERAARISDETAERIRDAVAELGYAPNQSARSLRMRRTNRVLFLGGRLNSLYSQAIAQSIEPTLERHGFSLGVQVGPSYENIKRAITALSQNQADGLIVELSDLHLPELRAAATRGHAIVAIGPSAPEPHFDVMSSDTTPAIHEAMSHLIDRHYRHFVLMYTFPSVEQDDRIVVARERLRSLGVPDTDITIVHCPHDRIAAFDCATALLPDVTGPVAVYAGADVSAIGVLWASLRLGLRVPQDVGIVGHGNTSETLITAPSITTLGPASTDFGRAADLMVSRLREPSLPGRHVSEPCLFFARESS